MRYVIVKCFFAAVIPVCKFIIFYQYAAKRGDGSLPQQPVPSLLHSAGAT